jgi:hypothetical protein
MLRKKGLLPEEWSQIKLFVPVLIGAGASTYWSFTSLDPSWLGLLLGFLSLVVVLAALLWLLAALTRIPDCILDLWDQTRVLASAFGSLTHN